MMQETQRANQRTEENSHNIIRRGELVKLETHREQLEGVDLTTQRKQN